MLLKILKGIGFVFGGLFLFSLFSVIGQRIAGHKPEIAKAEATAPQAPAKIEEPKTQEPPPKLAAKDWRVPETACSLMLDFGLKTTEYKSPDGYLNPDGTKEYFCLTPLPGLTFGNPYDQSTITYYVVGTEKKTSWIYLSGFILKADYSEVRAKLANLSLELTKRVNASSDLEFEKAILSGKAGKWSKDNWVIEVRTGNLIENKGSTICVLFYEKPFIPREGEC